MMDAPVLVAVEPASTEKLPAVPREIAASDWSGKQPRASAARTAVVLDRISGPPSQGWRGDQGVAMEARTRLGNGLECETARTEMRVRRCWDPSLHSPEPSLVMEVPPPTAHLKTS